MRLIGMFQTPDNPVDDRPCFRPIRFRVALFKVAEMPDSVPATGNDFGIGHQFAHSLSPLPSADPAFMVAYSSLG
jgi:hypothetical protein